MRGLVVQNVTRSYPSEEGPVPVLRGVTLAVAPGESVALTGESGSGKSTLLHLVAGLDAADEGTIRIGDAPVTGASDAARAALRRDRIGLVFQQFNLIPSLDVAANLAFQARLARRLDPAWQAALTARLGLDGLGHRYPEQLSGGQQQRVAIGRALAHRPALILADEPTGNLDETTADTVLDLLLDLVAEAGASLVMATHSTRLATRLGRRAHLHGGRLE